MYKIYADKTLIYDSTVEDYKLAKGSISLELNKSGSFSFSLYPEHFYYDKFERLKTVITVYKFGKIVFRGRILNDSTDYWNCKNITCEGELGFLQDSIIRPFSFAGTPEQLFTKFITEHNAQVDEFKKFKIGTITVSTDTIERNNAGYESAFNNLNSCLLDNSIGGYFYITHGDDGTDLIPTINYLSEFTNTSTQKIEFGVNLKDYVKTVKASDIATAIIPLGHEVDDKDDKTTNLRLTIADVNDGLDYIYDQDAVNTYGWIFKTVEFDDITEPLTLKRKAEEYLPSVIGADITVEIGIVDLKLLDPTIESINLGENVIAISTPHNFNSTLLCTRQTLDVLKPDNDHYTLGKNYQSFTASASKFQNNTVANFATNKRLNNVITHTSTMIEQTEENVRLEVQGVVDESERLRAELELKLGRDENDQVVSMINASADVISLNSNRVVINSDNFNLTENGSMTARNASIMSEDGNRFVNISNGIIMIDGDWDALPVDPYNYVYLLLMKVCGPAGDVLGVYCRGTLDESNGSFIPDELQFRKLS